MFYGVFSAWVLWARQTLTAGAFRWREAVWHLRVPVLAALFQQLSPPARLQPLGLVEVLDWTAAALDRVDRGAFCSQFDEGEAVPYFYESFLEAFDPALRKQLGVWYTPAEFSYRFNRRFSLREMFPRLAYVALRTPPMPYRLLQLAENYA